jgi:urease beta subunit
MSSIPALNSAITGIMRGTNGVRQNAAEIASADRMRGEPGSDLTTPLVEMIGHRTQAQASAKVIQAVDQMLGTLIDIRA